MMSQTPPTLVLFTMRLIIASNPSKNFARGQPMRFRLMRFIGALADLGFFPALGFPMVVFTSFRRVEMLEMWIFRSWQKAENIRFSEQLNGFLAAQSNNKFMATFNKIVLIGNLTRDPEIKFTQKGTAICKIGLAVNRAWTNDAGEKKEEVLFVDVDTFGRTAENVGQYMKKGSPILIEGRLKMDTWNDKTSGEKKSKLGVVAENVQFLGGGQKDASGQEKRASGEQRGQESASGQSSAPAKTASPADDSDCVPF